MPCYHQIPVNLRHDLWPCSNPCRSRGWCSSLTVALYAVVVMRNYGTHLLGAAVASCVDNQSSIPRIGELAKRREAFPRVE